MNSDSEKSKLLIQYLDEADFFSREPREQEKLRILRDELVNCFRRPSAIGVICAVFENGARQDMYKQGNKILETFPSRISTQLGFSAAECVAFAYCLLQSQYRIYAADAYRVIKLKCPEITNLDLVTNIHTELLAAIGQYIYGSEELSNPSVSEVFIKIIKARITGSSSAGNEGNTLAGANNAGKVAIAQVLLEYGPNCSASADSFRHTLHSIGIKLDEEQVAAIMVTIVGRAIAENEEKKKMEQPQMVMSWNLDAVADALFQECRGMNWAFVAKFLDHPALVIRTEQDYQLLTRFFVRIAGAAIPALGLLAAQWQNRSAQYAMLTLASNSPRNLVDFSALVTAEQLITGEGITTPPNLSWLSLNLYQRFLALASTGMLQEVMEVMSKAAVQYPEYFLVSLSQIQDSANSGVRSELLRRLLPLFTGLQGSRPSYPHVMRKLHTVNPEILILLCRIAFKKAKFLWEVSNVYGILAGLGLPILRKLEEEGTTDELLSYYCLRADKGELNLEEKIVALLEANPKNARIFANFAKQHCDNLRPRQMLQSDTILSFESCASLLRSCQNFPAFVPLDELRAIAHQFTQTQQNMQMQQQRDQQDGGLGLSTGGGGGTPQVGGGSSASSGATQFPPDAVELARLPPGPESQEIETLANSYFQKIYTTDQSIVDVIALLRQFKGSTEKKDQEIFRCMIHNLFDEYRFYHKYPEKELQITGRLFGALIQHQLVSSITLGIALRYVLEALRKDPELGESNDKMFRFGRIALDQFRMRLPEWPQYCSHLIQIPHLGRHCPEMYQEAQRALSSPQQNMPQPPNMPMPMQMPPQQQPGGPYGMHNGGGGLMGHHGGPGGHGQPPLHQGGHPGQHGGGMGGHPGGGYGDPLLGGPSLQQGFGSSSLLHQSGTSGGDLNLLQGGGNSGPASGGLSASSASGTTSALSGLSQQFGGLNLSGNIGGSLNNLDSSSNSNLSQHAGGSSFGGLSGLGGAISSTSNGANNNSSLVAPSALPAGLMSASTAPNVGLSPALNPMVGTLPSMLSSNSTPSLAGLVSAMGGPAAAGIASPLMAPLPAPASNLATLTVPTEQESSPFVGDNNKDNSNGVGGRSEKMNEIQRMAVVNSDVLNTFMPPEAVRDQIHFIVNNIAKNNLETKTQEIKNILKPEHYNWFANYLVVKRVSTQPNLHPLYLTVLESLDLNALVKLVLDSAYHNVTKLLQSPNITTSSSERSLLRNLGVWLGQMTLAKNKPLLLRRMNLKELLFWGFETGRLIAVCSFVAKIVEGVKDSKVFRPPNPWLMAILGVMRELYEIEDLKLNIKFEVQVLCKNINIKIEDIPKSNELSKCKMPIKDSRNPDFNVKPSSSSAATPAASASPITTQQPSPLPDVQAVQPLAQRPPVPPSPATGGIAAVGAQTSALSGEQQLAALLASLANAVVINPSLTHIATNPTNRKLVATAVERGIREIMQSAVERSTTIAITTAKHVLLKDFATEGSDQNLRDGARLMVTSLCGNLALATCKEPLRIAIGNHLRSMLASLVSDQSVVENIVTTCSNDNVDLGAALIEKVSVERALKETDDVLTAAYAARKSARESGQQFSDAASLPPSNLRELVPEALRPRTGGLLPNQLRVYEAFTRARMNPASASSTPASSGVSGASPSLSGLPSSASGLPADLKSLPSAQVQATLTMTQALEGFQTLYTRVDTALRTLHAQLQGREVTISMLGAEHEILVVVRDIVSVAQRIVPTVRNETAGTFCETVFNRMFEGVAQPDPLRLEVNVAILEAVRDACGGAKNFTIDLVGWLGKYSGVVNEVETNRRVFRLIMILLLRAKLLHCPELDTYFLLCIDQGRNIYWLELALSFIRQCIAENLGTVYDFGGCIEAVTNLRTPNQMLKKQLQKWLTDVKTLAAAQEESKATTAAAASNGAAAVPSTPPVSAVQRMDPAVRELVTGLLDRWLRVWNNVNDQVFANYLQLLDQYGVLKTEESADKFFRVATEICVEACARNATPAAATAGGADAAPTLNYTVMDAVTKLFLLLVRIADKDGTNVTVRMNLLSRVLNAAARALLDDHEISKNAKQPFDQRPYYRFFSNMSHDLGVPDAKSEPSANVFPLLVAYTQVYLALQPGSVPGFAYGWLQLISRRSFMPHLLLAKGQKGWPYLHRLLCVQLQFLNPFLKTGQAMSDAVRKLYKGTLRVLLVLLHDVPEFLSDYHLSFCDLIPSNCVQLRNLILSAFPRNLRLPDPFTPNLKIDTLAEGAQPPKILNDYSAPLASIKPHLDNYLAQKMPLELPAKLPTVFAPSNNNGAYNPAMISALVVYVGSVAIAQLQSNKLQLSTSMPAMDIYRAFIAAFDAEGRYIVLNVMANQLRYPNSHTSFFSFVLLVLFAEAEGSANEYLQEQVTRVLLERLIVHRPHPWGLLITFIELIKNPRYGFWRKSFTRAGPEMERVFESIARSCLGAGYSAVMEQQQQQLGATAQKGFRVASGVTYKQTPRPTTNA